MEQASFKYWAFLSYSHADEAWVRWLHRALERYAVPARLVGKRTATCTVPRKLFPVFRDRDELAGSAELGPELQRALEQSRFLIVVCSPRAATSHWVGEEIRQFKALGRGARVLALIVDGEPHAADRGAPERECFPAALKFQVDADGRLTGLPAEPIAADARAAADGKDNAALKLIAGILGVGYDELKRRDLQARHRRLAFVTALTSGVAALTLVLAIQAYHARNDALRRQQQAEDLIQFMLGDLRDKLEPIGKLAILDAVGQKALDYFATLDEDDRTDAALAARAKALRQIGDVRLKQGNLPGASEAYEEALGLYGELLVRHPSEVALLQDVADSEFAMGNAHYVKGAFDDALTWIRRNAVTAARLVKLEPDNPKWLGMLADSNSNLGALAYYRNAFDQARDFFRSAADAQRALVQAHPQNDAFVLLLAQVHGWLSATESAQRQWARARAEAVREAELLRGLVGRDPENANYRERLVAALIKQVNTQLRLDPPRPDDTVLIETLDLSRALAALDPDNVDYARMYRICLTNLQEAQLYAGRLGSAAASDAEALALARTLLARSPERAELADDLLKALARSIKLALLRADRSAAETMLAEALSLPWSETLRESVPAARWLELHLLAWQLAPAETRAQVAAEARAWHARTQTAGPPSPELMARFEILNSRPAEARRWAAQLSTAERKHPFIQALHGPGDAVATALVGEARMPP